MGRPIRPRPMKPTSMGSSPIGGETESGQGDRLADRVSLQVVDAQSLQGLRDLGGADEFGHDLHLGFVGEMDGGGGVITNAFAGNVTIGTAAQNGNADAAFTIKYEGLGQEACVTMATSDWGSGSSSGLVNMTVSAADKGGTTYSGTDLPVTLINAAANCNCTTATCSIQWTYL